MNQAFNKKLLIKNNYKYIGYIFDDMTDFEY